MLGNWGDIDNDARTLANLREYRQMFLAKDTAMLAKPIMDCIKTAKGRRRRRERAAGQVVLLGE
jgi:hypothetical protein